MPHKVFKYPLEVMSGVQTLDIPEDAAILHIGSQDDKIMMWYEVNPAEDIKQSHFRVYATGEPIQKYSTKWGDEYPDHLGTVQMGKFVWHVYRLYLYNN